MIPHNAEAIGHISPRPRIEIGADHRARIGSSPPPSTAEICARLMRLSEGNRIWTLIEETAGGHGASA